VQLGDAVRILAFLVDNKDPGSPALVGRLIMGPVRDMLAITIITANFSGAALADLPSGVQFAFNNATIWCGRTWDATRSVIRRAVGTAYTEGPDNLDVLAFVDQNPKAAAALGLGPANESATAVTAIPTNVEPRVPPRGSLEGWEIALIVLGVSGALAGIVACTWLAAMHTMQRRDAFVPCTDGRFRCVDGASGTAYITINTAKSGPQSSSNGPFGSSRCSDTLPVGRSHSLLAGASSSRIRQALSVGNVSSRALTAKIRRGTLEEASETVSSCSATGLESSETADEDDGSCRGPAGAIPDEGVYFDLFGTPRSARALPQGESPIDDEDAGPMMQPHLSTGGESPTTTSSMHRIALDPPQTKGAVMYRMAEAMQARVPALLFPLGCPLCIALSASCVAEWVGFLLVGAVAVAISTAGWQPVCHLLWSLTDVSHTYSQLDQTPGSTTMRACVCVPAFFDQGGEHSAEAML
jgi:hypothetical protein